TSNLVSFFMYSASGLKTPLMACSRPPLPSASVAYHELSGGVPAEAITVSLVVTSGSASIKLTVMSVCGVNVDLAALAYHWLWPVCAVTPLRVRMSIAPGPLLWAPGSALEAAPPQAARAAPASARPPLPRTRRRLLFIPLTAPCSGFCSWSGHTIYRRRWGGTRPPAAAAAGDSRRPGRPGCGGRCAPDRQGGARTRASR